MDKPLHIPASTMIRIFSAAAALVLFSFPTIAQSADDATLVSVTKIWDQAKHNAFTDLVRFDDHWFCVFREGDGHVSDEGKLRVITSTDGKQWSSAALIGIAGKDLRDAKITVTPDSQLMLSGAAALPPGADHKHQSLTWFSNDGHTWSDAYEVGDKDVWLWRSTWNDPFALGIGYGTQGNKGVLRLYRSEDGKTFSTWVKQLLEDDYPMRRPFCFEPMGPLTVCCDATAKRRRIARNLKAALPPMGVERPGRPHRWSPHDRNPRRPHHRGSSFVRWRGAHVALLVDPEKETLEEFLAFPSGGDTSYAGLAWHDDHLWVSYYSGHERAKSTAITSIYFAKVKIGE